LMIVHQLIIDIEEFETPNQAPEAIWVRNQARLGSEVRKHRRNVVNGCLDRSDGFCTLRRY
jgi:hypothetical protein